VISIEGQPWWVVNDVCMVLGILNSSDALKRIPEDGVAQTYLIDNLGRKQLTNVVNEPALYELIFRSDKPSARAFQKWVYSEVLPSLRKTGGYGRELSRLELAEMVVAAEKERIALELQLHEAGDRVDTLATHLAQISPEAGAWRQLAATKDDWLVEEVAKILNRDPAIDIGPKRLWNLLYEWDVITRYRERPTPRQQYIDRNLFRVRIVSWPDPRGGPTPRTGLQIRVTYDGIVWLHQKLSGTNLVRDLIWMDDGPC
jgi:prophage antirepressor-like protein